MRTRVRDVYFSLLVVFVVVTVPIHHLNSIFTLSEEEEEEEEDDNFSTTTNRRSKIPWRVCTYIFD